MCGLWSFRNSKFLKCNVNHTIIVITCIIQYLLSQFFVFVWCMWTHRDMCAMCYACVHMQSSKEGFECFALSCSVLPLWGIDLQVNRMRLKVVNSNHASVLGPWNGGDSRGECNYCFSVFVLESELRF